MTILLSRIAPRGQPVDVHAPLGEIEWQRTIKHIEATLPASVPVYNPVAHTVPWTQVCLTRRA